MTSDNTKNLLFSKWSTNVWSPKNAKKIVIRVSPYQAKRKCMLMLFVCTYNVQYCT